MDVEILARLQFAVTIMFHYIYPPLSIGLGIFLVIAEGLYLKTGSEDYHAIAKFWTKVFALTFAIGVATGIVMEFEFGTNWATYSRYVGDIFGSALAAEGVFAFFLESGFLALLLFGWDRIGKKLHFFSTCMVCLGAHFSAIWIVVANSWMQTPRGYHIVGEGMGARAEITSFWEMVFNPSSVVRLSHVVIGCWLAAAFLVISISAYYLLKKKHTQFAKKSITIAIIISFVASFLQLVTGHESGEVIAKHQPSKLAAFEALFETKKGAPLVLFGLPDVKEEKIHYEISIPNMLSVLVHSDPDAEVKGLDQFPKKDWPNVKAVFPIYRIMLLMWVFMVVVSCWAFYLLRKDKLEESPFALRIMVLSVLFPQIANQAGWVAAEMGRYPWIVQDLLRISDALSKTVTAEMILGSLIMFSLIYTILFILFIYLLHDKIKAGPADKDESTPYHHLKDYVKEVGGGNHQ
ncbi:cytochrome ubiquinol oxidase subunit I [Estrella lausannensis]|uniref:Putative cytochrome d ubiquinol oxidase subunit 1 n=1 Tax=Estrella lausannensis TaxID=483423 RepID=A0A0H5DNR8_9BACT|nr:cytochrome ubiquinol oxidase subunit I [Estrella lausannensis]CRX38036.1 putative cytochrome d ubiquinol oxidase subunit 1 [Estrella lausannensis]